MKAAKKSKIIYPEVHVLGDLQDAENLVSGIGKKKTVVIFKDVEQSKLYFRKKTKIKEIQQEDIMKLEKDHRLIFISFFPGLKKDEPLTEEKPDISETEKKENMDEGLKKNRNGKKVKKDQKENKEDKEPEKSE